MLVPMRRIEIVAPRARADALLRTLHRSGSVQLVPFEPGSGMAAAVFSTHGPSTASRADELLELVAPLAEGLGADRAAADLVRRTWELDDDALAARVDGLDPVRRRLGELQASHERQTSLVARLAGYRRIIEALRPVVGRLPAIRGYGSTAIILHARYRAILAAVRAELEEVTAGECEMVAGDTGGDRIAAILVYPLSRADAVQSLLGVRDLEELTLPEDLAGLPFPELTERLAERERDAQRELRDADAQLAALAEAHGAGVAALRLVLADRVAEARALRAGGSSDHLVLLSGWVPESRLGALERRLADELEGEVWIENRATDSGEQSRAPVAIQNPPLLQAFAPLASFVSLPRYGTLDPTPILAVTFPVFVGLMVGDVAYGLILLAALVVARRRWRYTAWMGTLTPIVGLAAISTIAFGVLYGEWFGDAGHALLGIHPVLFDRAEAIVPFLLVAVGIGVGQVGFGLVLGIINSAIQHEHHQLAARIGLLALLLATLVALGWMVGFIPASGGYLAIAALSVSLVVLIASLGLAGPIEAIGMLGNVLSYARLMAIGMASVMLAIVANRLGGTIGNVAVGLIVAGLLHAVNLVLGFFDASVQGLRLHYVEFFSKFVEPGGTRYEPFASALGASSDQT